MTTHPISCRFEVSDDIYDSVVVPNLRLRRFKTLIVHLLEAYSEDDHTRAVVDSLISGIPLSRIHPNPSDSSAQGTFDTLLDDLQSQLDSLSFLTEIQNDSLVESQRFLAHQAERLKGTSDTFDDSGLDFEDSPSLPEFSAEVSSSAPSSPQDSPYDEVVSRLDRLEILLSQTLFSDSEVSQDSLPKTPQPSPSEGTFSLDDVVDVESNLINLPPTSDTSISVETEEESPSSSSDTSDFTSLLNSLGV